MVYLHLLKQTNTGTVWDVVSRRVGASKNKFKYLFFALGACIHAAKFMRKVLIIDATTIKAKFRGCLLTAIFQDGNFQIMPLGFAVVDSENEQAWTWFFKKLMSIVPDADDLAACAYTVGEFRQKFDEIERRSPLCANYLRGIGISHWSRVYFQGKRYNIMSSNIAESLNAAMAKALEFPIVSMVETIRMMLMRWFYCRRSKANKHLGPVTPEVEELLLKHLSDSAGLSVSPASADIYQVSNSHGILFTVDLDRKTCTCKVFETLGIPCSHALAAARVNGIPIPRLVEENYKSDLWRNTYSVVVMLVPDVADHDIPEDMLNPNGVPPETNAGPGRPRKRRIPSNGEERAIKRRKIGPSRCRRCYGTGHNRATCRNPIP
ncbi:PREDICTED: uncharacterized protein LOC104767984 [Camelina sativa]|uniref:Uncharacterized protein LOC104767984 n=1 Tax=Camelina sativa TaxID=90675 RepID=A0ABM0XS91_CAMSA|nr:PREDICTED: uncharacterized protein LOC104767984 [Camelina sativa]